MKQKLKGFLKLTRADENLTKISLTLLAIYLATENQSVDFKRVFLILLANYLIVIFSFMINDVEDWEDDSMDAKKKVRNPISAGILTLKEGYLYSFFVVLIASIILCLNANKLSVFLGLLSIALGFLYSWRKVRLKGKFLVDVISHSLFLGGLVYLIPFLAFEKFNFLAFIPFVIATIFSFDGSLYNQMRDFENDKKANLKNTAITLGFENTLKIIKILRFISAFFFLLFLYVIYTKFTFLPFIIVMGSIIFIWIVNTVVLKQTNHNRKFGAIVQIVASVGLIFAIITR